MSEPTPPPGAASDPPSADAFAEKMFAASLGALETFGLYLGERLGWFASLAERPATSVELAERTGCVERYVREWLEMQAVYGNLTVVPAPTGEPRRYVLEPGPAEVLTDPHSLAYLGAMPRFVAAVGRQVDALLTAYRTGGGVSWAAYGPDAREAQAALNRPWFETALAPALASLPRLHALLDRSDARIADLGCGAGWSSLALARAYPAARVLGFDLDAPSLGLARTAAADAGLADRVRFVEADAAAPGGLADPDADPDAGPDAAGFDVVFAFECLHDLPRPVEILAAARRALRPGGVVVVVDEAVADAFVAPGDVVERAMYGYSTLICLPDSLSTPGSVGTGTVMRLPVLQGYATQAGLPVVEVLPVSGFGALRFYGLEPEVRGPVLRKT